MGNPTTKHTKAVRLAIVGAGGMANTHATQFKAIRGCRLTAVVEIDDARRAAFAATHGIPAQFATVDELLAADVADAVTIVTPDAFHAPLSIRCLRAGLHVMCEKPLALDYAEARRMVAAAKTAERINLVNFSYRNWPCIHAVAQLVHEGTLGQIRHVEASYLQSWLSSNAWGEWRTTPAWLWRLSRRHGSAGVLGDIGVHIVDFATYPAGSLRSVFANLATFAKAPRNRVGEYRLDANDSAVLNVEFANGALGVIHTTRWSTGHLNRLHLKISGTLGGAEIDSERSTTSYRVCLGQDVHTATWRDVEARPTATNYQRFIRSIRTGRNEQPDFARGAEVQRVLDAAFTSAQSRRPVALRGR
ncbi:Gfo/Idh/MocA family oxidoreductase [Opitutales bacterium ASA1]|uniref:Gfo/Idh/MocA family protein n=1 Tax=Congregicoccus parvus TaxID=3081749 RepID=UPI002B281BBC|nr:Gfo/Idh/MocA family oxidoreductase [Opitutales bacterium ASA1]